MVFMCIIWLFMGVLLGNARESLKKHAYKKVLFVLLFKKYYLKPKIIETGRISFVALKIHRPLCCQLWRFLVKKRKKKKRMLFLALKKPNLQPTESHRDFWFWVIKTLELKFSLYIYDELDLYISNGTFILFNMSFLKLSESSPLQVLNVTEILESLLAEMLR